MTPERIAELRNFGLTGPDGVDVVAECLDEIEGLQARVAVLEQALAHYKNPPHPAQSLERIQCAESTVGGPPTCELAGPGRGDCEHFIGLPGKSIPGQHDGPDDTVDDWGKPNGWCWTCWSSHRYHELLMAVARKFPGETRHQTALRYIREAESNITGPCQSLDAVATEGCKATVSTLNP